MEKVNSVMDNRSEEPQFAAFLGIDWADQEHVWCLQACDSEKREMGRVRNRSEEMETWIGQLCQRLSSVVGKIEFSMMNNVTQRPW